MAFVRLVGDAARGVGLLDFCPRVSMLAAKQTMKQRTVSTKVQRRFVLTCINHILLFFVKPSIVRRVTQHALNVTARL